MKRTLFKITLITICLGSFFTSCKKDDIVLQSNDPVFHIDEFAAMLSAMMEDSNIAFQYCIAKEGQFYTSDANGWALNPADNAASGIGVEMTPTTRMNIASITKPLTGTAVMKMLYDDPNISMDSKIAPYLPSHWDIIPTLEGLTFRQCLTHTTGIAASGTGIASLKETWTNGGIFIQGDYFYSNENFAIFRLVLPYIFYSDEMQEVENDFPGNDDKINEAASAYYVEIINDLVLAKAGIDYADCKPTTDAPRLYNFPNGNLSGVDPGDWTLSCGGGGWNLSSFELLAYMSYFSNSESIVPASIRQKMWDESIGCVQKNTEHGMSYSHGGALTYNSPARGMYGWIIYFPNNVQFSVLINSRRADPNWEGYFEQFNMIHDFYNKSWH